MNKSQKEPVSTQGSSRQKKFRITNPDLNPFKNTRYESACLSQIDFDEQQADIISQWLSNPHDFLYIYSDPGVGKTHLTAAITNYFYDLDLPIYYVNEEKLFSELKALMNGGSVEWKMETVKDSPFLILDDIGCSRSDNEEKGMTIWQKDILFQIIDHRYTKRLPTILVSNYALNELKDIFHERLVSRLESTENITIKLKGHDRRKSA